MPETTLIKRPRKEGIFSKTTDIAVDTIGTAGEMINSTLTTTKRVSQTVGELANSTLMIAKEVSEESFADLLETRMVRHKGLKELGYTDAQIQEARDILL